MYQKSVFCAANRNCTFSTDRISARAQELLLCKHLANTSQASSARGRTEGRRLRGPVRLRLLEAAQGPRPRRAALRTKISKISKFGKILNIKYLQKICKILAGSFSAVSKRNFARKYAFDSIFQALQDLHPFAPLHSQNFRKKSV